MRFRPETGERDAHAGLRVLWATDGSEGALSAAPLVNRLLMPVAGRIVVLTVAQAAARKGARAHPGYAPLETGTGREDLARAAESAQMCAAKLTGGPAEAEIATASGHPVSQILRVANSMSADIIVVGGKGYSDLRLLLLGSVAQGVVQNARRPVLVTRPMRNEMSAAVVGVDGTPQSKRALRFLARLNLPPATLLVLATVIPRRYPADTGLSGKTRAEITESRRRWHRHRAERIIADALSELPSPSWPAMNEILSGEPAAELLETSASYDADLIVVGSRKPSAARHYLIGSTAERLVRHSDASVLVVR